MKSTLFFSSEIIFDSLSKEEFFHLEAYFFAHVCRELKNFFRLKYYQEYFRVMKLNTQQEDEIMEIKFVRHMIKDILSTEEYSLPGLVYYTRMPEEVIYEVAIGKNTNPSSMLLRKIIEIHQSVRPDIYQQIIKKIMLNFETQK